MKDKGEEIINVDNQLLASTEEKKFSNYMKSYFYQNVAKRDSTSRVYDRDVVIGLDDIYELNGRIIEKLSKYNEEGFIVNVSIQYSNRKFQNFGSWDAFERHQWIESEPINSIIISWEFNAVFKDDSYPLRHTLLLKLSNRMRPEEILNVIFSGNVENLEEIDKNFFPIVASVDFVDRVFADELLYIVSEWVKGLSDSEIQQSSMMMKLKRYKNFFASIIKWVTYIVIVVTSSVVYIRFIDTLKFSALQEIDKIMIEKIIIATFILCGSWISAQKICNIIYEKIYDILQEYGGNYLFNITKGDKKNQEKLRKISSKTRKRFLINILGTLVLNIICTIIANILF